MSEEQLVLHDDEEQPVDSYVRSLEKLQELRRYRGEPAGFWDAFVRVLAMIAEAATGAIFVRGAGPDRSWRVLALAPQSLRGGPYAESMVRKIDRITDELARDGVLQWRDDGDPLAAVELETDELGALCVAVFVLARSGRIAPKELTRRLRMSSDVPAAYQARRVAAESKLAVERIAGVLDLMAILGEKRRFMPAAMAFCNELSARMRCERVSLGWLERGCVRLRATSHVDRFDHKSDAVRMLEAAMEEAIDQNCEVGWPDTQGGAVTRDHRAFAREHDARFVFSIPLRIDQEPVAVCTCERSEEAFSDTEIELLRLVADQGGRRLADLKSWDRWFGARLARRLREALAKLFGFEHTWLKVLAIILAALGAFVVFANVPYRVSAPLTLKTDDIATISAPFAGHIEEVAVRVGDRVERGATLLALDQTDLLLTEAQVVAEMESYRSEADKARATGSLADMRIALSRRDQANARYNLVRYRLARSVITSPFEGVVVEGDLQGRIGLPVSEGDTLFKVARIDRLYAVIDVSEQDIRWIHGASTGTMALASRPQETSRITVTRIEPQAVTKSKGNVFLVDCSFPDGSLGFWRPGMTGVAKIDAGARTPLWLVTHRTADFFRLRFWW